jgi:hypothetical protein
MKCFVLTLFFAVLCCISTAQEYQIITTLDSSEILIGDPIHVKMSVRFPEKEKVIIPQFHRNISDTIVWIENTAFDTSRQNGYITINQVITITSFDEGTFYFPSLPLFDGDSVNLLAYSQSLPFIVTTISVDTTAAIRDIKTIVKVPITIKELLPFLAMGIGILLVVILIVWLVFKFNNKKKPKDHKTIVKQKVKADVAALQALEQLWNKKLWQEGHIRQYYSELSDIIRIYLADSMNVTAMEMTTADILLEMEAKKIDLAAYEKLRELLVVADLVKFAKWDPYPDDHNRCFNHAKDFVKMTANQENTESEEKKE